jgi:hypothetical protein
MAISKIKSDSIDTVAATKLTGTIPEARISSLDSTKLTGTIAAGRLGNAPATDLSALEMNQAILAFKIASANQLAKFSMVDQVIDEYQDATGIDAPNSNLEVLSGSGIAKYFEGGAVGSAATVSGNYDDSGTNGNYAWYKWTTITSTGYFTTNAPNDYEYLVVAGGGGGGAAGGGGGGGYRNSTVGELTGGGGSAEAVLRLSASTVNITVGDGGAPGAVTDGTNGNNSIFATITSAGGGGGGYSGAGKDGGSGGAGGRANGAGGAAVLPTQGYAGGQAGPNGPNSGTYWSGGGGGGAGQIGESDPGSRGGGDGGDGLQSNINFSTAYRSGGGGGGKHVSGSRNSVGGNGGGGYGHNYTFTAGTAGGTNLGGGGGGGAGQYGVNAGTGGKGGSGVVIIRRDTTQLLPMPGANLILQSQATTSTLPSGAAPTTGDLVLLVDDGGSGTTAVQTNVKGFISRNGNFNTLDTDHKQVTFVDEGTWGTTKQKILVARNVDLSGITTGTSMKYRLTTHAQLAGTMETRIHATSLAWA